jgi:tetratricopeptide (TPR) repeat protein
MKSALLLLIMLAAGLLAACPGHTPDKPTDPVDAGMDGTVESRLEEEVEVVARPVFDPDKPAPCESHTACYLAAKEAHASGKRAGYLLALDNCEYYRGRYQLEKFYGMCLLILADAYRHLNNFEESSGCFQRFLDAQPDDQDLALQAREGIEEVKAGKQTPGLYRRYLEAVSLLNRFNQEEDQNLARKAKEILDEIQANHPEWQLNEKVGFLLGQLAGIDSPAPALEPVEEPDTPDGETGDVAPEEGAPAPAEDETTSPEGEEREP